jgi:hypothetical protein
MTIRVDQGSEFVSQGLDLWAFPKGVALDFSRPGKRRAATIDASKSADRRRCPPNWQQGSRQRITQQRTPKLKGDALAASL